MNRQTIDEHARVGDVVAQHPQTAAVFTRTGIDFCCRGGHALNDAADKAGVSLEHLIESLDEVVQTKEATDNPANLPVPELIDHIVDTHHAYVLRQLPVLTAWLGKLVKVHGGRHPELVQIDEIFRTMAGNLVIHMRREEMLLFPGLKKAASGEENRSKDMDKLLQDLVDDHAHEGDRMAHIRELTSEYTTPQDGCATYRAAFMALEEFETDLHSHVHLENHVLFEQAKQLQARLN
jgi:regulator of cell morphogenesis and NO signaling